MTALAKAGNRAKKTQGTMAAVGVLAATQIWKGSIVALDANGFAIPATDTAGLQVIGIADESVLGSAVDGEKLVRVVYDAAFLFTATSITRAMTGDLMVVVDDNTVDDAAGATNDIPVGRLVEYVSTTQGWVYVPGVTGL